MSAGLRDWIQGFAPDIVYSQLHGLPGMSLIDEITRGLDLPLALHIMDDWPNFLYGRGVLRGVGRGHMERRLRSLMGRASSLMAISGAMADEYAQRYGRTFLAIHNPVDLDRWDALAATFGSRSDGPSDDSLRVVYTGRFGLANEQSISDVAETVSEMSSQGAAVSLQVNTPDHDSPAAVRLAALHGVVVTPAGEYSRVPGLMRAADVLLLPLDFDEEHVQLMRLSMPTKVSEYLATGRPVLTYAPRGSATAEYSRGQGWSLLVDDRDPVAVRQALELLSRDQGLRAEMGSRARRCAEENHDARCVRERFRAALAAGALGSGGSR
jgi:glycosyltransferase involved in cell wall biosynthesis